MAAAISSTACPNMIRLLETELTILTHSCRISGSQLLECIGKIIMQFALHYPTVSTSQMLPDLEYSELLASILLLTSLDSVLIAPP